MPEDFAALKKWRFQQMAFKFRTKMAIVFVACTVVVGIFLGCYSLYRQWSASNEYAKDTKNTLNNSFDKNASNQVQNAISMLQAVYDRGQKNGINLEETKKDGADILRQLKYDKDGYFWADTYEGVNVVNLGKPSEGKNRIDIVDKKGKALIREIIEKGRQPGGGYTDYWFPRPESDTAFPKRSYSLEFKPFGWVIGTGNYIDDIGAILAKNAAAERSKLINNILVYAALTLFSILSSIVVSTLFSKHMIKELGGEPGEISDIATRIADGDLSRSFGDQTTTGIHAAIVTMSNKLKGLIDSINIASQNVSTAAYQVNSTAEQIATGSEEVAAQTATVATAGEEMSATSSDIASNCQMAAEGAQRAAQSAQNGAVVVDKTIEVMGQIAVKVQASAKTVEDLGKRSDQIGAIIGTIEDIADQTNLLALNAAIEAARAGEQGRGFAVVADEVRALAERTTRATKEIGEVIKAIQKETKGAVIAMEQGVNQVEAGTAEAEKSGGALRDILEQINDVAMQVNQIATAAEEQTATTREISNNMIQITQVVQDTASGAHQAATAAAQLNGNADELQRLVRQFKL
jgi:methyl-accepting chemotaxis protein